MKSLKIFFLFLLACSCNKSKEINSSKILNFYLPTSANEISINSDTVLLNNKKYNGFLFELSPQKDTILVEGYSNGLLHGVSKKWYPNKQLRELRYYWAGKKEGKQTGYWENGNKRFEFIAKNGEYEGELKEWSVNGHLFHLAHYVNGHEEGTQKMWYDNGKIRANYVIINGKRYGLLGTKNCKNVSDSIFIVK